uniref:DNA replication complex GINS protein PSF2 n=1 Tax=Myxine glutinosa TaxID=7769 RepID=UPI00358EB721
MEPAEVEFLAEKEMVSIIPNFSLDKIYLIGGDLGPFNPGLPVQVPVWLALNLKQRQKCRVQVPEWMDVEKLQEIKEQEQESDIFTPMPNPHYMELSKMLLHQAPDDIPNADDVRTLLKDVWDTRMAKLRLSMDSFVKRQESHAQLTNLTLMEINTVRPFLLEALNQLHRLRANSQPEDRHTDSQD